MRVLLTGSRGFIGRHLQLELLTQGNEVVEFDTKHHLLPGDIFQVIDFSSIDFIFHLGAITSTLATNLNAIHEHNVDFSIQLFEEAILNRIPVVYTSSASIYGNTMKTGQYIYNPLNYYATSKMLTEMWLEENKHRFVFLSVPRLFNVYGQDEQKTDNTMSPVSKFKKQAKNDGVIKVFKGSGNMIRDFICIEDVIWVLMNAMTHSMGGFYDVGTAKPISFLDVAQLISEKYDAPIKFIDMPDEMRRGYQYYTKAREILHTSPISVEKWLESHS